MTLKKNFENILTRKPDIEVLFEFNGTRRHPAYDGYRPNHLVNDTYLTSGLHRYSDVSEVPPNGQAKGTITFLSPEAYPKCLWEGKKIQIQEGERVVGYAIVIKIFNKILEVKKHSET